jgi:adenosylhomocysteine nucleosidase
MRFACFARARLGRASLCAALAAFPLATFASSGTHDTRPILFVVGMQSEAKIARGSGAAVVISAGNADILKKRLEAYSRANVRGVISFGVAGGLSPDGNPGDLYLSNEVITKGAQWNVDAALRAALAKAARAAGLSSRSTLDLGADGVSATTPAERQQLHKQSGADVVDNESHIAAAFAQREGLPFAVVRVVSDPSNITLPPAALLPLKPNGAPDGGAILKSLAEHPGQLGMLIKIAGFEKKAETTLKKIRERIDPAKL